jgi:protein gp37
MNPEQRDRFQAKDVAFFFKRWAGRTPKAPRRRVACVEWQEMQARRSRDPVPAAIAGSRRRRRR